MLGGAILRPQVQGGVAEAVPAAHRTLHFALQCLGAPQRHGNTEAAGDGAMRGRRRSPSAAVDAWRDAGNLPHLDSHPQAALPPADVSRRHLVTFEVAGEKKRRFEMLRPCADRYFQQSRRCQIADHPSGLDHPPQYRSRKHAPPWESATACCGCRWGSKISRTCSATSPTPWRIGGLDVSDALELHAKLKSKMPPFQ